MDAELASLTDKLYEQVHLCFCREAVAELDGDDSCGSCEGASGLGLSISELGVLWVQEGIAVPSLQGLGFGKDSGSTAQYLSLQGLQLSGDRWSFYKLSLRL